MNETPDNPLQHVCLLLDKPNLSLAASQLVTQGGFSASLFLSAEKAINFLQEKPLTAALMTQQTKSNAQVREKYKGPIFPLSESKEEMISEIPQVVAELHRRQMQIDHPSALAALRALIRFITGQDSFICFVGRKENLDLALSIIQMRIGFEGAPLPTNREVKKIDSSAWFISRNLFQKSANQQLDWIRAFRHYRPYRQVILEETSLAEIDSLEGHDKINEHVFELVAARPLEADVFEGFTLEELCVQPMHPPTVTRYFDDELFQPSEIETKASGTSEKTMAKAPGFLERWFRKLG